MMSASHSSGNLTADRRYAYAQDLSSEGDFVAAAELYEQMLDLVPGWAAGWFALGEAREKTGELARARLAFARVVALCPEDPLGAGLHLARLEGGAAIESHAYIATLFDQYAHKFDAHLVGALHYRGPQILKAALDECAPQQHFTRLLDLGCGTGLMAKALHGRFAEAIGVDLSRLMLREAEKTGLYKALVAGELAEFLRMQAQGGADLVVAADVFVYCGALEPIFAAVRGALAAKGLFGFTVQNFEGAGYGLGEDLRFAHAPAYIRACAEAAGLTIVVMRAASTRQDRGVDVPGLVVILQG